LNGGGEQEKDLEAVNRRGKPMHCRVRCSPLKGKGVHGVILLMEELAGATS